ncbi:MAG: hypothetical protein AB8B53_03395 [Flavobacteriales bacterium]
MKFNKINIDRAPLTADEINSAMDFEGLINPKASVAAKSGGGRIIKLGMYTLAAAAITLGAWFYMTKTESTQLADAYKVEVSSALQSGEDTKENSTLTPPLKGYEKDFLSGTVIAETGGELTLGSSVVSVPPSAFVDENGVPITGEVELKYREFNDVLDIFLSGIPMEYDSAGVKYTFESNGMFELRGFQESAPVYVASDKSLEVKMGIDEVKSGFSEYVLNETTGEWIFKNGQNYEGMVEEELLAKSSAPQEIAEEGLWDRQELPIEIKLEELKNDNSEFNINELVENEPKVKAIKEKIKSVVKEKEAKQEPTKPAKANPALPQIQIEVDYSDFPELKAFKNTLFQVAESDLDDFNMEWGQETWTDMKINKSTKPGFYRLVFSKPGRRETVNASPVLEEADMATAMVKYEELFSQYETAVDSLETVKKQKEKELEAARAQAKKDARERAAQQAELQKLRQQQIAQQNEDRRKNRVRTMAEQDELQKEFREKQLAMTNDQYKQRLKGQFLEQDMFAVFSVNGFGFHNCDRPQSCPSGAAVLASYETDNESFLNGNVILVEQGTRATFKYYPNAQLKYNPKKDNLLIGISSNSRMAVLSPEKFKEVDYKQRKCVIKMKECEKELSSKEEIQEFIKAQGFDI